jgi:pimeloyl-ACP methyl ester carboxylesterase
MVSVHHRYATVGGRTVFYRESGDPRQPAVVLLHGAPASSFMFRGLIPLLSEEYYVVAPDLLGFGLSDAPAVEECDYTFDALTESVAALIDQLGIDRYTIYVQDYGAPVGWRLALRRPDRITAIVTQNGNAYPAGFVDESWQPFWSYAADPSPETARPLLEGLTLERIRWQYTHGVPDPTLVDPDVWIHDHAQVNRPGNPAVQLKLYLRVPLERRAVPAGARVLPGVTGAAAGRLGPRRPDLRPGRSRSVPGGPARGRGAPAGRRPLPAGKRAGPGRRADARISRAHASARPRRGLTPGAGRAPAR